MNTYILKSYTKLSISVLLLISQTQKQPRCPSAGKWVNHKWVSHPDSVLLIIIETNEV